ncbi:MAG: tRNA uridine-5-carboxymethylaminomethyl(34) synthesis enzyme MnmG [Firmicutes bacterium]|nr:tRNA uridine-5-carboxymethylaminomethyl(34) synthesis enzyme MnmG [Bacillota bacterium]
MEYLAGKYDVIVVGAGHAGCEAGLASARMGMKTLVLTISMDNIAMMPCNPAMGGPAKAQLIREIDALGGEIAVNTDLSAIQMRMLNTAKGPAVQAMRAQADKKQYQINMAWTLENQPNLDLKQVMVEKILVEGDRVKGVAGQTGAMFTAGAVIITTGTFLQGRIIIGDLAYPGGPGGQFPSVELAQSLRDLGFKLGRFKTGTPARVDKRSIDFSKAIIQPGDERLLNFSFDSGVAEREQIPCWLTYSNIETHAVIRENLHRSPLYSGFIEGTGPRYCPSIEDKVVRFADKPAHQVFIEPEGKKTNEMYVQGMSTSLPEDVQLKMYRTLPGLEKVEIIRPGYAIEYDYIVPSQLNPDLQTKGIAGLFAAGQINGTSGYEEAAAQGIIAGINAVRYLQQQEPFIITRSEGYIGVLIDDLVTKGVSEPYRLLTSRAEYRLTLRQDNADMRLTEKGYRLGLVTTERYRRFMDKKRTVLEERERLARTAVAINADLEKMLARKNSTAVKEKVTLATLLKRPEIEYRDLLELPLEHPTLDNEVAEEVEIEIKYEGYIKKQNAQIKKFEKMEGMKLPVSIDYAQVRGLAAEAAQKLNQIKPLSIGQATRISGVNPADISVLMIYLEQEKRKSSGEV